MKRRRMLSVVVLAFSAIFLSAVFCAVHTSAQQLGIFSNQSWNDPEYFYIGVPETGGSFEFSYMFHTNQNCDIFGQLPSMDNAFTDSTKFTNHFYLYDKNGTDLIEDLGTAIYNASESSYKTNYTEIIGNVVYRMKITVGITARISNETYSGRFWIVAKSTLQAAGESGGALEVALNLPVNATIVIDDKKPVIDEIYAYSGTKKVPLNSATLTEWAPTIRATYHDPIPSSGVQSVWIKLDGISILPDKQNATSLYYNVRAALQEGMHNFTINVTDYAANSVQELAIFNISRISDITAPTITPISPSQDEILNIIEPTFIAEWHDNENGSGIKLSEFNFTVDGSQYSVPSSDISDTGFRYTIATKLHNGPHWWSVQIKDYAGNSASRLINFTVNAADEFPPSSSLYIIGVDGWDIILSWNATDNLGGVGVANVTIYYAINSYHDIYGAYAWTRWMIFSNDTTNATFDTTQFDIQTGDTMYFRSVAVDWNGNEETKWEPDASIIFEPTNRKTILELISNQTAYEGQLFSLQVNATDLDNDTLIFSDNSTLFDISFTTGAISFTPNYNSAGVYFINVTVTDGTDIVWQIFKLTVINVNRAPNAIITLPTQNTKFSTNDNIYFDASGSFDLDNDTLTYIWTSSIDGNIGESKVFYKKLSAGTHTITLSVSDGTDIDFDQIVIIVEGPSAPQGGWKFIPGFDAVIVIIAISGVALALKRRKR